MKPSLRYRSNTLRTLLVTSLFLGSAFFSQVKADQLEGSFVSINAISTTDLPLFLEEQKSLDQRTLIIMSTVNKKKSANACQGTEFAWGNNTKEKIKTIMDFASANQVEVYFGLVWSYPDCGSGEYLSPNKETVLNFLKNYSSPDNPISYITSVYQSHPSFAGWYISDEPALGAWTDINGLPSVFDYWKQYAQAIKNKSSKPIIVASYMCGVDHHLTPTQLGERAKLFDSITNIDIYAWQDCVNAQGLALYSNNPDGRYTTLDYYKAISQAVGKSKTWADIEISNCCIQPNGVKGGTYKAASFQRVLQQIANAPEAFIAKRVAWINQLHLSKTVSNRLEGAERLYHSLKSTLPNPTYLRVVPKQYEWTTPPDPSYPDSGNEMFDGKVGESKASDQSAKVYIHSHYTGILGKASLTIDLGQRYLIDYVAAHTINYNPAAITFPSQMKIACSQDKQSWETISTQARAIEPIDSEYMFGNNEKLSATCQYLKLDFANNAWTFLSEIEILAKKEGGNLSGKKEGHNQSTSGDLNADGKVDIADYQRLVANFRNPYTIFDYQKIVSNFGK